jgi:hypothetical protein
MGGVGAKMGTSMVLGMGSQYMPEEAQGAMAMGAMVGQINPMLGLGVAGLGTAMSAKTKKGGALSGALGGAALGATIGSVLPGVGTAVGAIVGTVVGSLGGIVMGHLNAQRAKAKAAKAVADKQIGAIVDISLSGTYRREQQRRKNDEMFGPGVRNEGATEYRTAFTELIPSLKKSLEFATKGIFDAEGGYKSGDALSQAANAAGMPLSTQDKKDIADDPDSYVKQLKKQADVLADIKPIQNNFNSRMDELKRLTGMTDSEITDLAGSLGVNLFDSTVEFTDVVSQLGVAVKKTADEMKMINMNTFVDSLGVFGKTLKRLEVPKILDETARAFKDKVNSGGAGTEDKLEFLQSVGEQIAVMYGEKGGGTVGQAEFEKLFGGLNAEGTDFQTTDGKKKSKNNEYVGGKAFNKGGMFENMDPQTFLSDPEVRNAMITQITDSRAKLGSNIATQLNAVGADKDGTGGVRDKFSVNAKAVQNLTNAMSPEQFAKFGTIGVLMRIEDKIQRSLSITKSGVNLVNDEGLKDTLLIKIPLFIGVFFYLKLRQTPGYCSKLLTFNFVPICLENCGRIRCTLCFFTALGNH